MLSTNSSFMGIVVLGPTASGKSDFAHKLAQNLNGAIICADSLQIYDGLPLLTAQPTVTEKKDIPHFLYEHFDAQASRSSAAAWRVLAIETMKRVLKAGRVPIFVGGTGFYVKALLEGLSFIPEVLPKTIQRLEALETSALATILRTEDPLMAARIQPADRQRMVRALSVLRYTGKSLSFWHDLKKLEDRYDFCVISLCPDVVALEQRIRERFDAMMCQGVAREVEDFSRSVWGQCFKNILPLDIKGVVPKTSDIIRMLAPFYPRPWPPITHAIGFAEILVALGGGLSFEDAGRLVILRTRQYAKRQRTWLRHQVDVHVELKSPDLETVIRFLN